MKFKSIWGDLDVGNVQPATEDSPKVAGSVEAQKDDTEVDGTPDIEQDNDNPPAQDPPPADDNADDDTPPATDDKPEDKKEPTTVEYSEDDVSKAYTMLEDEGVLDLNEDDEFDATPQGIADAVAATIRNKMRKEFEKVPEAVNQLYNFMLDGGDPADFKVQKSIPWADVDDSSEDNQRIALRQFYMDQDMTREEADAEVQADEEAGRLESKASIAFKKLIKKDADIDAAQAAAKKKAAEEAEKARTAEIETINKTIDGMDEMAGFKMTEERKKKFKDYIFKANPRTGKTQMQANMSNEERRLRLAFLDFMDYNKEDLAKEVANDLTKQRKKKLSRYTDKTVQNSNSSASIKTKVDGNKGKIKFPTIFGGQSIETED